MLDAKVIEGIENSSDATIESLLRHMSGIESWEDDPVWIMDGRGERLIPEKVWGKEEPLGYIRRPIRNPEEVKPGVFSYSNSNFTFLGLVVERVTGNTVEAEVSLVCIFGGQSCFLPLR